MGKDGSLISVPRGLFTAGLLLQASNRAEQQHLCPKSLPLSLAVCHEGSRSCAVKHFFISPRPAFSQPLAGPSCCDGLRLRYPHSCLSPLQPMPPQELPSAPRAGCGAPLRLHCPTEEKAKAEAEQGTSYLHPNPCGVPGAKGQRDILLAATTPLPSMVIPPCPLFFAGAGWWPAFSAGSQGKDPTPGGAATLFQVGRGCQVAHSQVWGWGQARGNAPGAPRSQQSLNQRYGREVVGVRGPPLSLC